ncbi:cupin [Nocardiopsis sp. CNR-923]|uniref:cupin domain-containing protein n=1 Tax=Nocardiopsis sp. CNR-923 TaxID=1904965 RepID=UPI000966CB27|nr:cupin domain-containing protein [Nocardiopsis sp. CNR-923]OLT26503.1 cupin [Nocardiopsis sp. CNR-923]
MPIISGASAPTFSLPHATFTGLAAPSRGAEETCVWRTRVHPGAPGAEHWFDREEVLVAVSGAAVATLDGVDHAITAGDAVIVPARTRFALANPHGDPFEAVVALPVGARAHMGQGEPFTPPPAE